MDEIFLTEEQCQELIISAQDPVYWIEKYCWIELKETGEIVPFKLFEYQKTIIRDLHAGRNVLVLKSRRVGASWALAAYAAWLINFKRGINVLFVSRNEDAAKNLLKKVKFVFFNVAENSGGNIRTAPSGRWMMEHIAVDNQQFFAVAWRDDEGIVVSMSEVASLTTTKESGRGDSATFVFLDEFAFLENEEETMRAARFTAMRGGQWVVVSTPNGVGDIFHAMCMRGERGDNQHYQFHKVHWTEAEITEQQIEAVTEGLGTASREQEMELAFLSSGDPVFNPTDLAVCYRNPEEFPEVQEAIDRYKFEHELAPADNPYYSGVDTAHGKLQKKGAKRDYHSFTALTKSGIQIFAYHAKDKNIREWAGATETTPNDSTVYVEGLTTKFHKQFPGYISIEENGPGLMTVENHKLPDDNYSWMERFTTTQKSKGRIINQLVLAVETHSIIITDFFTYQCMLVFQRGSTVGTFGAPSGDYYDDPVISLALAYDQLIKRGAVEFPWGSSADSITRRQSIPEKMMALKTGPRLIDVEQRTSTRLSSLFEEDNSVRYLGEKDEIFTTRY